MNADTNSYAVLFPNHPDPELTYLPWGFQQIVATHWKWYDGLRMAYYTKTENWVAWITEERYSRWKTEFEDLGAILVLQKRKIEPSEAEKRYNITGIK